jgi:hypothetical protein
LLTERAIPSDRNVILKYKSVSAEIQQIWNMKHFVTTAITGATGILTKGAICVCKQYLESVQKIVYKNSCRRDIAYNKESATVRNLKSHWLGYTTCSTGEVLGEKKLVIRGKIIIIIIIIIININRSRAG